MKTLYAWFGARECKSAIEYIKLNGLGKKLSKLNAALETYYKENNLDSKKTGAGAIRETIENGKYGFEKLVVLIDYKAAELQGKCSSIVDDYGKTFPGMKVVLYPCVIPDKYDLNTEYEYGKKILRENYEAKDSSYFLLESGTGTMTACWILLGRIFCQNAFFIRRVEGKIREIDIKVDLDVEIRNHFNNLLGTLRSSSCSCEEQLNAKGIKRIIGHTDVVARKKKEALKAASCDYNVLLTGETGTGKEIYARAIVEESNRKEKPYVVVNCASLSPNLAAAQLFGHTANAFTGGEKETIGKFEEADKGTLFLDEIEALPMEVQGELLRVLEGNSEEHPTHRTIHKVTSGTNKKEKQFDYEVKVDVRVIAATNVDLRELINERKFRSDLYYRLNDIEIYLPKLSERTDDVMDYANYFLGVINHQSKIDKHFSENAKTFLMKCDWSAGNQRELKKRITRAHIFSDGETIEAEDLQCIGDTSLSLQHETSLGKGEKMNLARLTENYNQACADLIKSVLNESRSLEEARRRLGLDNYQTLKNRMEKLGIDNPFLRRKQ